MKSIQAPAKDSRDLQLAVPQSRLQQAWAHEEEDLHEQVKVLEGLLAECQMRTKEKEEQAKAAESQVPTIVNIVWFPDPSCMGGGRKARKGRVW